MNVATKSNFYHYLILRRYSFAWKICSCPVEINKNQLACVLGFVSDLSDYSRINLNTLFNLITNYSGSSINKSEKKVTFFGFFFGSVIYSKFNEIQNNAKKSEISLDMVKNSYEQGLLDYNSTNITLISKLFLYNSDEKTIENIDFKTFFIWSKVFYDMKSNIAIKDVASLKKMVEEGPKEIGEIYKRCEGKVEGEEGKKRKGIEEKELEMEFLNSFLQVKVRSENKKKDRFCFKKE